MIANSSSPSGDSTPISVFVETPATSSTDDSTSNSSDKITRKILLRKRKIRGSLGPTHNTAQAHSPSSLSSSSSSSSSLQASSESQYLISSPSKASIYTLVGHKKQGTYSKYLESSLLLFTAGVALFQNKDTLLLQHKSFLAQYLSVTAILSAYTWQKLQFPNFIYEFLFPPLVALTIYPQHLRLNLILSLGAFPTPIQFKKICSVLIEPLIPGALDHALLLQQVTSALVTTSLTGTEIFLFSALLLNLLYNAQSVPALYLQTFLFGSLFALRSVWFWVDKIMKLSMPPRPYKRRPANSEEKKLRYATYVLIGFVLAIVGVASPILSIKLSTLIPTLQPINSITFLLDLIFAHNIYLHLALIVYWTLCLAIAIIFIQSHSLTWSVDIRRKAWHATVVIMFLPAGVIIDPLFTKLAMSIALTLFFLIEFVRVTTIPPFGKAIHISILRYIDDRDTCGPIVVSHIFLMLGISIPIFLASSPAGIICLGMGDAMASIVGKRLGKHNWPGSKKTVEGSIAFVLAVTAGLCIYKYLQLLYSHSGFLPVFSYLDSVNPSVFGAIPYNPFATLSLAKMFLIGTATALLEAVGGMNDNVIVPIYMLVLLQLS